MKRKRNRSRPIVQGYLERINSKILDDFREQITDQIQGRHGVYVLYRKDKLYYIGLATNLKSRINQHLRDRHKGKWDHFSLYVIKKEDHIRELECLLLRISRPRGNNLQGKLNRSCNLLPILKQEVKSKIKEDFDRMFGDGGCGKKAKRDGKIKIVFLKNCPLKGLLKRNQRIYAEYKGEEFKALVRPSGAIRLNGKLYRTPSGAAKTLTKKSVDGWSFWKFRDKTGDQKKIKELRV